LWLKLRICHHAIAKIKKKEFHIEISARRARAIEITIFQRSINLLRIFEMFGPSWPKRVSGLL